MAPISTSLIPLEPHFTKANNQLNYRGKSINKVGGDEPSKEGILAHMALLTEINKIILEKYKQYQGTMQLLLNGLSGISCHLKRKIPFNISQ